MMRTFIRLAAAACLVLCMAAPGFAASRLFVSEYAAVAFQKGYLEQVAQETSLDSIVDFSGGVASSSAFNSKTIYVRLVCDTQCAVKFGVSPTAATATNKILPALVPEYFAVPEGASFKVSVIASP